MVLPRREGVCKLRCADVQFAAVMITVGRAYAFVSLRYCKNEQPSLSIWYECGIAWGVLVTCVVQADFGVN